MTFQCFALRNASSQKCWLVSSKATKLKNVNIYKHVLNGCCHILCADPEEGTGGPAPPPPWKNHKSIRFSSNTGPDLLKIRSYQASIQCWAINGTPAKRHLMTFRWRADDGPLIVVVGCSLPSSTKNKTKKKRLSKLDSLLQNFLGPRM